MSISSYNWDYEICWLNDSEVAVWGEPNIETESIDVLGCLNINSGKKTHFL